MTEGTAQAAPTNPGLVAFADCDLVGINNAMMWVTNRGNGNQQIMSPQVVEGLKTCTTFDTIEAHAAHLAATRAELSGNHAMATTVLQNLQSAGMLLQAGDVCEQLAQPATRKLPPTRAFIITCDRPAAVERLLDSLLSAGQLTPHNALFLVDDSRDPDNCAANRELVATFNLRSARDMFYIGEQAQAELLQGLLDQLPGHAEGIRFLLDREIWTGKKTYGRARTLCLLLSVGYRALVMDDDIICKAILPPITDAGIGIGSGGLRKAAFYGSREEALRSGMPANFNPLSGHATLLGSTLSHALNSLNGDSPLREPQLQSVNAALANILRADSSVLVTQCGSLGDPGTGGHWGMYLGEDSVQRLLSSPLSLQNALENRNSWLGSSRPNIMKMPFMSQLTGLDNSQLLPPYFPAFRAEDALFGAMLVCMHPSAVALEYPWSVPHLPLEHRAYSIDTPMSAAGGGLALFARYLTENIDYRDADDPAQKLVDFARDARRIAARTDANLLPDYRAELTKINADQLYQLMSRYEHSQQSGSEDWQAYLKRGIEEVQAALVATHSPAIMMDTPQGATDTAALAEFRQMALGFAASLAGWVEMREVAAGLTSDMIESRKILPL